MSVHPWIRLQVADDRRTDFEASARPRDVRNERRAEGRQQATVATAHFAHRESDGLTVDLYWEHGPHHDAFRVEVVDSRERRHLTLHPPTGRAALDAFYHPLCATSYLH
jgi:hypothetical protein